MAETRAALYRAAGAPPSVETITLDAPRSTEVLVRIAAVLRPCRTPRPQLVTIAVPAGYPRPTPGDDSWVDRPLEVTATSEGWWLWTDRITG
jgi:hypothetical protein